jgi:hypothetical protein
MILTVYLKARFFKSRLNKNLLNNPSITFNNQKGFEGGKLQIMLFPMADDETMLK